MDLKSLTIQEKKEHRVQDIKQVSCCVGEVRANTFLGFCENFGETARVVDSHGIACLA